MTDMPVLFGLLLTFSVFIVADARGNEQITNIPVVLDMSADDFNKLFIVRVDIKSGLKVQEALLSNLPRYDNQRQEYSDMLNWTPYPAGCSDCRPLDSLVFGLGQDRRSILLDDIVEIMTPSVSLMPWKENAVFTDGGEKSIKYTIDADGKRNYTEIFEIDTSGETGAVYNSHSYQVKWDVGTCQGLRPSAFLPIEEMNAEELKYDRVYILRGRDYDTVSKTQALQPPPADAYTYCSTLNKLFFGSGQN